MFVNFDRQCMRIGSISLPVNDTLGGFAGRDLTGGNFNECTCYEFGSWSRPYLLGYSTKTLSKMALNDFNWRKTA